MTSSPVALRAAHVYRHQPDRQFCRTGRLFTGRHRAQQLIMLDAAKAWDLVFPDSESFNAWAEQRYRRVLEGLRTSTVHAPDNLLTSAV